MKKNINKKRGIVKEREAKKYLESCNYTVIRARGSLGPVDLIAWTQTELKFISIKRTKKKYTSFKKEESVLKEMVVPFNSEVWLWVYFDAIKGRKAHWKKTRIKAV